MKKVKKGLRLVFLIILLILACCGVGIMVNPNSDRYMDKEVKIELVEEKKEDEVEEDQGINKN